MKKMLILLVALSSGALYGVCSCQLKPKPQQTQPTQAPVAKIEDKEKASVPTQTAAKPQEVKVDDKK
jgi:hypothetical protein